VDRIARCKDTHIIAGGIHNLIIQNFRDQQDLRPRHQIEEMLNSDTTDDKNLFGVDRLSLEHQPTDNKIGCSRASSIAHQEHLIHFAGKIERQSSADESVNRSPPVPTIINTQSQDMYFTPTEY